MIEELVPDRLRPASKFAVEMAEAARRVEGVGGVLIIKIPNRNNDPLDVRFMTGEGGFEIK